MNFCQKSSKTAYFNFNLYKNTYKIGKSELYDLKIGICLKCSVL